MPNFDLVLRGLRVHDDEALRRCDPHAILRPALHAAHQAAVLDPLLSERPDQQADRADVSPLGHMPGATSAMRR